ncbi:AMP-binding protein [Actinoplanes sp. NPDC049265]|uniref:AMP-binding protein n=1 Tax=Actinoplanes sp. NPDC049265 TaxID=3363902 RepID=UPI00371A1279
MTTSVAAVLADAAVRRPDHPALICGTERVTYAALWKESRRYAAALSWHGVRPGLPVAILVQDDLDFPRAYFAVLAAGAVAFPLNPTSSVSEIGNVLSDAGVRFLICAGPLRARAEEAAGPHGTTIIPADALLDTPELLDGLVPRSPDDLAVVFYTSGTTGTPKGVMLSHRNILSNVHGMRAIPYAFRDDDVLLGGLPLAYSFGQICGLLTAVHAGITLVMMPRFTGTEALRLAVDHHCTVFMGVPTMYLKMLDAVAAGGPVPGFDRVYSGGSALPVTTFHDVRRVFGCPVYEGYGATETATSLTYNHPGVPCRPGTVGVPIDGVTIGVAEPNATGTTLLPAGTTGEIVARGDNVMVGYLGRPDLTAEVITDGWFRTGDLGRLSPDGYLRVVGRKTELILRGGHNVHPREIEEVLTAHPSVEQVAVIGLPHSVLGEEVCAVIIPTPAHDASPTLADDIVNWSKTRLSAHKYPRRVQFVSVFPTGPSGKILKRELVSLFAGP